MNDRLRIGDAEREEAARELGEHFALGRISVDEHAERLEQVWSARTAADLAPVFGDLPRARARRDAAAPGGPRRRPHRLELPYVPFPLKVLVGIVLVWWGFHHLLLLLLGVGVYVVFLRRFVRRRRRWHERLRDHALQEWGRGRCQTGWH